MEKLQLLIDFLLISWKCEGLIIQNVTLYNEEKSWEDAANLCLHKGGVLESNVTLLSEYFTNNGDSKDVWLGKIKLLTQWTFVRGCFYIYGDFKHFVIEPSKTAELECQMLCGDFKLYSIKGAACYCIKELLPFHRTNNCNCVDCYKVWEHQYPDFDNADKHKQCIAAVKCEFEKLKRSSEKCEEIHYDVTCDNGVQLRYNFSKYQSAADECARRGSFIKWYPDNFCETHELQHHYWTSGTRHIETFRLRKAYFTENLQTDKCFILKVDENEKEEKDCKSKQLPYFCRFEIDEDKGDIISIPNLSMPQQKNVQSDDSGSIAAGTVTSMIVVIVVISVLVFIHRRRLSKKKPTIHESQSNSRLQDTVEMHSNYETSKDPVYNEIDIDNFGSHNGKLNCSRAVNNITYEQVNSKEAPKSQNVIHSATSSILTTLNSIELQSKGGQNEYEMAKVINVTGNSSEVANSSNYCLAKPITNTTEEESDPYDINKDYDHLNNVQKKEDPITKVYDHLPTAVTDDPTYDHSNLKSASDNGDYYDHFKNDGDLD